MFTSNPLRAIFGAGALLLCTSVQAALYEPNPANFGVLEASLSDCDDCASAAIPLGGGHTINLFGVTYASLFASTNGYVTFGTPQTGIDPAPLNEQPTPTIAALYTDLDTRNDAASKVYINTGTAGQVIITWVAMGHFDQYYSTRSTFQLVIRSDQFPVPAGEGRIGFFYTGVGDTATASAGFSDGQIAANAGEPIFFTGAATGLNNAAGRWYSLGAGGVAVPVGSVTAPVPTLSEWGLILLSMAILLLSLRRQVKLGTVTEPCCATS